MFHQNQHSIKGPCEILAHLCKPTATTDNPPPTKKDLIYLGLKHAYSIPKTHFGAILGETHTT